MSTTLLLDRDTWDLCLTSSGDMAVASEPYAQEQDVASECRVLLGEAYYDTTIGVPYGSILGVPQPVQVLKESLIASASRVPGVSDIVVYLTGIADRAIGGQIQFNGGTVSL